jgi:hypothetical protein
LGTLGFLSCSLFCATGLGILGVPVWQDWNSSRTSAQDYHSAIAELQEAVARAPILPPDILPASFFDKKNSDFLKASPADQRAYLSRTDPDFAKGSRADQNAYLEYLTHGQRTVEIPESVQKWEGPWEKYAQREQAGSRQKKYPPGFIPDFIPDKDSQPRESLPFPAKMSDEDIMHEFETKILVSMPSFSMWVSIKSHRATSFSGTVLVVCGLLGSACMFWWKRRPIHEINTLTS